jgi:hypothetical protein
MVQAVGWLWQILQVASNKQTWDLAVDGKSKGYLLLSQGTLCVSLKLSLTFRGKSFIRP